MPIRLPSDPKGSAFYLKGYYDAKLDYEKTGKWKEVQRLYPAELQSLCECSVCGNTVWVYVGERRWKFCPNCGARMEESVEYI